MDNFLHISSIWLHVLGVALWLGPQFFMAFAWVPASRRITDLPTRVQAMTTITRRFGYIGGIGLLLLLISGMYQISTWRDYYAMPDDVEFTSLWYGLLFVIKMNVLIVMLILAGLHVFVVGPRQLKLLERQADGEPVLDDEIRSARRMSMMLSIGALILTLALVALGIAMGTGQFSFDEV